VIHNRGSRTFHRIWDDDVWEDDPLFASSSNEELVSHEPDSDPSALYAEPMFGANSSRETEHLLDVPQVDA
jgi:hypothetical protein